VAFLTRTWDGELEYRLIKEVWACHENRIAARFAGEWRDDSSDWFHAHGNEQREFEAAGPMRRRKASINDVPIPWGPTASSTGPSAGGRTTIRA
jgi:nuclear transport factor 2 (NTF2) superfamily protein